MKVLFISANTETVFMVPLPLGLNLVAVAAREAGHTVELLDLMGVGNYLEPLADAINRIQPDAIAISVRNIDNQNMGEPRLFLAPVREIVACCRARSHAPIIVGGAGYSIFPDATLRYLNADLGIRGEGEITLPRLLTALERGDDPARIPGVILSGRQSPTEPAERMPLRDLPLPDPALWHIPAGPNPEIWVPFQTRRGCPMRCSYCSTPVLEGTIIRPHPIPAVVECLTRHVAYGFTRFYFVDNVFNLPPTYARQLCHSINQSGLEISWRCILYPGFIDEELVKAMATAGCVEASLGFESGDAGMLKSMGKHFEPGQVRAITGMLVRNGIRTSGFLLLGGPGETRESVLASLAFADSLHLGILKLTVGIRIYPETELERLARAKGMLEEGDDLLMPRFYLAPELREWLPAIVREWMTTRPHCIS